MNLEKLPTHKLLKMYDEIRMDYYRNFGIKGKKNDFVAVRKFRKQIDEIKQILKQRGERV